MKTDNPGGLPLFEVALDSFPDVGFKLRPSVSFSKEALSQSARDKAAFRRILDKKNNFVHPLTSIGEALFRIPKKMKSRRIGISVVPMGLVLFFRK